MPVVLVPIDFDQVGGVSTKRSIAIRTFLTSDFMTGVPAVPGQQVHHSFLLLNTTLIVYLTDPRGRAWQDGGADSGNSRGLARDVRPHGQASRDNRVGVTAINTRDPPILAFSGPA